VGKPALPRVHGEFSSATICKPRSGNPRNTSTFASWMFPPYTGSIKSGKNLLQCCRTYTVELHAYVAANTNTRLTSLEAELELSPAMRLYVCKHVAREIVNTATSPRPTGRRALCKNGESHEYLRYFSLTGGC
jgi:hypothetical protein